MTREIEQARMTAQETIGRLIDAAQERDAVHVAIAPVLAQENLAPGARVSASGRTSGVPVGIVDPFLPATVLAGQRFWLFLFPNTVTGMRHHWSHPSFAGLPKANPTAESWLRAFASDWGVDYDEMMLGLDAMARGESHGVFFRHDLTYGRRSDGEAMWKHWEAVTGRQRPSSANEYVPFSCGC